MECNHNVGYLNDKLKKENEELKLQIKMHKNEADMYKDRYYALKNGIQKGTI